MHEKTLYSIGDMAKLCGISARQLRYYDQIGVIQPGYRNPENNYRYYTEDQIELLFFLKDLKKLGISNDSVQRLFINRDVEQLVQELQINLTMVEQEIQTALTRYHNIVNALVLNTKSLAYLHGQEAIQSDNYSQYWVSIVRIPVTKILFVRYEEDLSLHDRNDYIRRVVELTNIAETMQIKMADTKMFIRQPGPHLRQKEQDQSAKTHYELAREIVGKAVENSEHIRSFGGGNVLCTVHIGERSSIHEAYHVLQQWAEDHGLVLSNTSIEEYMVDTFLSKDEKRFVTRVMIPLRTKN